MTIELGQCLGGAFQCPTCRDTGPPIIGSAAAIAVTNSKGHIATATPIQLAIVACVIVPRPKAVAPPCTSIQYELTKHCKFSQC